jgi:hypothetical protein
VTPTPSARLPDSEEESVRRHGSWRSHLIPRYVFCPGACDCSFVAHMISHSNERQGFVCSPALHHKRTAHHACHTCVASAVARLACLSSMWVVGPLCVLQQHTAVHLLFAMAMQQTSVLTVCGCCSLSGSSWWFLVQPGWRLADWRCGSQAQIEWSVLRNFNGVCCATSAR